MATLHNIVEELQYNNLQQEEQTANLEDIQLAMMELTETFTNTFKGFVDTFVGNVSVSIEEVANQLEVEPTSTEDRREAVNRQLAQTAALETTAAFVEKIYDLMTETEKKRREDESGLGVNIPTMIPMRGRTVPAPTPVPTDGDKDKNKPDKKDTDVDRNSKRKGFLPGFALPTNMKSKAVKGGVYGAIAYLGLEALGVDPSEFAKGIGATILGSYNDVAAAFKANDVEGAATKAGAAISQGFDSLVDLLFPKEQMSAEEQAGWVATAATAGMLAGGPVTAFLAGMGAFITTAFTADEVIGLKNDLFSDITALVGSVAAIFSDEKVKASVWANMFGEGSYERQQAEQAAGAAEDPWSQDALTISEAGVVDGLTYKSPEYLLSEQQDILSALEDSLTAKLDASTEAARDYDMKKFEYDYAMKNGSVSESIWGKPASQILWDKDLSQKRAAYERAREEYELQKQIVAEQRSIVLQQQEVVNNQTTVEVTKGHSSQKPITQK